MIGAARGPQGRDYQLLSTNTFTTGGTQSYSIPNGTRYLFFQMWGGGGGGAAQEPQDQDQLFIMEAAAVKAEVMPNSFFGVAMGME